jgi:hypothetical protein
MAIRRKTVEDYRCELKTYILSLFRKEWDSKKTIVTTNWTDMLEVMWPSGDEMWVFFRKEDCSPVGVEFNGVNIRKSEIDDDEFWIAMSSAFEMRKYELEEGKLRRALDRQYKVTNTISPARAEFILALCIILVFAIFVAPFIK